MKIDYGRVVLVSDYAGISPRRTESFLTYLRERGEEHSLTIQRALGFPTSVINFLGEHLSQTVQHEGDTYSLTPDGVAYVDALAEFLF